MKTIKFMAIGFMAVVCTSCGSYFRIVTVIEKNGTATREIYAKADSLYLSGDESQSPFLFDTEGWELQRLEPPLQYESFGREQKLNIKARKTAPSIEDFSNGLVYDSANRSFAAPVESVTKHSGLFYTYYDINVSYKRLETGMPVPIDDFITEQEQKLWSQGGFEAYSALNGAEMYDLLEDINRRLMDWFNRNCYELSLNGLFAYVSSDGFAGDKEAIFRLLADSAKDLDISPETVAVAADKHFGTKLYSEAYKTNKSILDKNFENSMQILYSAGNEISYELNVPGDIVGSNASLSDQNTLKWKVDGVRLLFGDYELIARYRLTNAWAFVLTGVISVLAIFGGVVLLIRRRR